MITWQHILETAKNGNVTPPRRVVKSDAEWRQQLTDSQYRITRQSATERPFSGEHCDSFGVGNYHCVCCQTLLFCADEKYDPGSGWPAFTQPASLDVIKYVLDLSHGMTRIEVQCNICDAHLGHVFPDGPAPSGLRYCINAGALDTAK